MRVARSRRLVAGGYPLASVARVLGVSRQALYRTPKPRTVPERRPIRDPIERVIVEEALDNQTDGYRMVCAFVRRRLGVAVNPKRVLRVMREHNLIQRRRRLERRKRPGFFRVERPRRLWQLDIDQYLGRRARLDVPDRDHRLLHPRARRVASIGALPRRGGDHARRGGGPAAHGIQKGELTLGSDNGSALTARRFKARLAEQGIRHRRGGYRDPESQAFIESWFGKLKEREVWLNDYETLDQARRGIAGYVARYHHRPHSGLDYRTPHEVRRRWEDQQQLQKQAA